jgi:hypothetical protein
MGVTRRALICQCCLPSWNDSCVMLERHRDRHKGGALSSNLGARALLGVSRLNEPDPYTRSYRCSIKSSKAPNSAADSHMSPVLLTYNVTSSSLPKSVKSALEGCDVESFFSFVFFSIRLNFPLLF